MRYDVSVLPQGKLPSDGTLLFLISGFKEIRVRRRFREDVGRLFKGRVRVHEVDPNEHLLYFGPKRGIGKAMFDLERLLGRYEADVLQHWHAA